MTGKEAIIHYLGTHKSFCAQDVAAVTGATVTSINQAAAKMARAGILVVDGKVRRTVYYRFATREEPGQPPGLHRASPVKGRLR
ncbi:hypothetical protein, partial [Escherichia coli]|uniref:hypothetical protein n=1 Tax=Escherichia coli TaxID=562 RepID=UPI0005CD11D9